MLLNLLLATEANAGRIIDFIREYDLNDYSFGLAYSVSQSPYLGAENSRFVYPFLTSFRPASFTDDWLLIDQGNLGFRWLNDAGFEIGAIGRIQTLGTGTADSAELNGIDLREWTLEVAPYIGWRGWPVHFMLRPYFDILDRSGGMATEFQILYPIEWERGYFIPSLRAIHRDEDYTNYYFGVTPAESLPNRPAYQPGASTNYAIDVRLGYRIGEKWLLSGGVGLEYQDDVVANSPIVDKDTLWSANISLAYNSDIFQPRLSDTPRPDQPRFEFRLGAFNANISSKVVRDSTAGVPGDQLDLEEFLGLEEDEAVMQIDSLIRVGRYHRFEFGYVEMSRTGLAVIDRPITFGDETFATNAEINSSFSTEVFRFGYAYSLMNDDQKELGIMAGVHYSKFRTVVDAPATAQVEVSNSVAPLPVLGLHGGLNLGDKWSLGARIQMFRMKFDEFEGSLNYATLEAQRKLGNSFSLGIAYNYYAYNLELRDASSNARLETRHHGPVLWFGTRF